ncbi:TetR/AcrR family transcriptional regulator [Schumannella luteola]
MDAPVRSIEVRDMTLEMPQTRRAAAPVASGSGDAADTAPALRADAQENRDRVLSAARELFAADGLGVTMREVARRAGVGPATLYRRFPTKHDLMLAAFHDEMSVCGSIMSNAIADEDAWRGFCSVIERITELNARNQGFADAFLATYPDAVDLGEHRSQMLRDFSGLARRAQESGHLRPDFTVDDFLVILLAGRGLTRAPAERRVGAARRFARLAIDGLRAPAAV